MNFPSPKGLKHDLYFQDTPEGLVIISVQNTIHATMVPPVGTLDRHLMATSATAPRIDMGNTVNTNWKRLARAVGGANRSVVHVIAKLKKDLTRVVIKVQENAFAR